MAAPLDNEEQARLVRLIAQKSPASATAVRRLYEHYRRPVISHFVYNRVMPEQAEDLFQETMIKMVRQAAQYSGGSCSAWIWTIARNTLVDHVRAPKRESSMEEEGWEALPDPNAHAPGDDEPQAVDRCVERRMQAFEKDDPERAWAVRQVHLEGWTMAQLAAHLGRTPQATRQFIYQCRKRLEEYLQPCRELLKQ